MIDILQDGFTGTSIRRNLGGDPILRREKNGDVHGSSLEFYAECEVDGEFSFLYTTNPVELKVQLWSIEIIEGEVTPYDLLWEGFVVTEQYSEPFIDPPYDVHVIATDGLGELKYLTYQPSQQDAYSENYTVLTALEFVLAKTGHSFPVFYNMNSIMDGHSVGVVFTPLRISGFAEQSYYDILSAILLLLHARIWLAPYQSELSWWIVRETDIENYRFYLGPSERVGRIGENIPGYGSVDAWPVGALQLSVEAAKSGVTLTSTDDVFDSMPRTSIQRFSSGTTYYARTTFKSYTFGSKGYAPLLPYNKTKLTTVISNNTSSAKNVSYQLWIRYNSTDYYYNGSSWGTTETYLSLGTLEANALHQSFEVEFRAAMIPTACGSVDLTVLISVSSSTTSNVNVEDISLGLLNADAVITGLRARRGNEITTKAVYPYHLGRKDVLRLSNQARFQESDINLPIALPAQSSGAAINAAIAIGKVLGAYFSAPDEWISDNDNTGREYISLLARDYALSFAQPRRRLQGTLHHEDYVLTPMLFLLRFQDDIEYLVETFNWNLRSNDVEFSAISLPATSITVASEEITYTD